jgi:hypothetical protein
LPLRVFGRSETIRTGAHSDQEVSSARLDKRGYGRGRRTLLRRSERAYRLPDLKDELLDECSLVRAIQREVRFHRDISDDGLSSKLVGNLHAYMISQCRRGKWKEKRRTPATAVSATPLCMMRADSISAVERR